MLRHLVAVDGKEGIPFASVGAQTYYVGRCGAHNVALLMCEMGSSKPGASAHAVRDALERWKPRAVLMVGIAFGRPDKGLNIGDVLVAEQIALYEEQRVGSSTVYRAPKPPASVTLVNRFRNALDWTFPDISKNPAVRVCEVLSGEKLVDNADFVARLFADFPNALGGEMEGAGLFSAAEHSHVPWALVKAVCDFGHGKSKEHQPLAAAVAASLVAHVLKDPAMLDGLPAASRTEDADRLANTDVNKSIAIDLASITSERFRQLCFYLARAELGFARRTSWPDSDLVPVVHVSPTATQPSFAVLICKVGTQSDVELIPSIAASLNAWPDALNLQTSWTLCMPAKPTTELQGWFEAEMRRRRQEFEIWDETRLRALLVKHEAVREVFFYRSSTDLRRKFVIGDLELYELSLDLGHRWHQPDTGVLSLFRATKGPADLVLDLLVRNRGADEEVLTNVVAVVKDTLPVAHGYGGTTALHRPENPYVLSLGHGEPGHYETVCEPRLATQGHRGGRIAVRLIDTGYSWTGFVRISLVFGEQTLHLPYLRFWT